MANADQQEIDKILDLDGVDNPKPEEPPVKGEKPVDSKPADLTKSVNELAEKNKNLEEQVRQVSETNKFLSEFKDKITGADEQKQKLVETQEKLKQFEENPLKTVQEVEDLKTKVGELENVIALTNQTTKVDRLMREIDNDYTVDWNRDKDKIIAQMKKYTPEEKEKDLKACLIDSCLLARAITKRDDGPNLIEEHRRNPGRPAAQSEIDKETKALNDRLDKVGKKKSDNAFGI